MRLTHFYPRTTLRSFTAALLGLAATFSAGCDSTGPTTGAIAITVSTVGPNIDLDTDGYTFSIDGGQGQAIGVNSTVTIANLPTGSHLVRLDGLAPNCSVSGTNPVSVDVIAGDNAASPLSVLFSVSCIPRTGSIRVSAATSGTDLDPNGYSVSVGAVVKGDLVTNGVLEIAGIREGQTPVWLSGVSENCAVVGANPSTVNVAFGATAEVAFVIRCGSLASVGPRAFIWTRESGMIALSLLPGATESYASAINNLGQVVGTVRIGNREHAFVWTLAGGMVDIGGLSEPVASYATAINNAGQVAGYSVDASGRRRAFRWSPSEGMIALGVLPGRVSSYARGINSSGQVVGESVGGLTGQRPFRWTPEKGMEDLGLFGTDSVGGATGISNSGDIVGFSGDGGYYGITRAVLWSADGGKRIIDGCTTQTFVYYGCHSSANAINSRGQIAGDSEVYGPVHAFRWTLGGDTQDLGAFNFAFGISEDGQVVGVSHVPQFPDGHAFLWSPAGGMIDLGVLNGKRGSTATGVNNSGQVVGTSQ